MTAIVASVEGTATETRTARAVRSAPTASLDILAARSAITPDRLKTFLKTLPHRGHCAQIAATVDAMPHETARRWLAPPTQRATRSDGFGSASWLARRRSSAAAPASRLRRLSSLNSESAAHSPVCPSAVLLRLGMYTTRAEPQPWTESAYLTAAAAATNPAITAGAANQLSLATTLHHEDLATNPACDPRLLRRFAASDTHNVRRAAALNANCDPRLLVSLAAHRDVETRKSVAANPATPQHLLGHFAADPDMATSLARNAACSAALLAESAQSPDDGLRAAAASNPSLPQRTLHRLTIDPAAIVSGCALRNPACTAETIEAAFNEWDNAGFTVCAAAAAHSNCPPLLLERLVRSGASDVSAAAAANPRITAAGLRYAANSNERRTRAAAARNPKCPEPLLQHLGADPDPAVSTHAQEHLVAFL